MLMDVTMLVELTNDSRSLKGNFCYQCINLASYGSSNSMGASFVLWHSLVAGIDGNRGDGLFGRLRAALPLISDCTFESWRLAAFLEQTARDSSGNRGEIQQRCSPHRGASRSLRHIAHALDS